MIRPRKEPRPARLKGKEMELLRVDCFLRDEGKCVKCGRRTYMGLPHEYTNSFHMSHIKAKRMGGDSLENVETLCGDCHRKFHQFGPSMTKPCPPKPVERMTA
jgi:5-methylcytosine-specific restriction endonuclease McrA